LCKGNRRCHSTTGCSQYEGSGSDPERDIRAAFDDGCALLFCISCHKRLTQYAIGMILEEHKKYTTRFFYFFSNERVILIH
jgi:hypothetical protein